MFKPVDYDFSTTGCLGNFGLEASGSYFFKTITFDGDVIRFASGAICAELIIRADAGTGGVGLKLKVKNLKGNATCGENVLISDEYVDVSTVGSGDVVISVKQGESFEFTGYSLVAQ